MNLFDIDIIYAFPISIGLFLLMLTIVCLVLQNIRSKLNRTIELIINDFIAISGRINDLDARLNKINDSILGHSFTISQLDNTLARKPVTLKFNPTKINSDIVGEMNIPTIDIFDTGGNSAPMKSALIWEGLKFIIENNLEVQRDNLNQVMSDYNSWMSKTIDE